MGIVGVIWVFNLIIVAWNIYTIGNTWVEARHASGWMRFVVWAGAFMTAMGLTWNIIIVEAFIASIFEILNPAEIGALLNLGYIVVIPGILLGGYAVTFDSWARGYRARVITDLAPAGYNSFASMYNTYHAIEGIPDAFGKVCEVFFDDEDGAKIGLVLLLVTIALLGGVIITAAGIWYFAARDEPIFEPSFN